MKKLLILLFLLTTPAVAQQPKEDIDYLNRLINVLQFQRNAAQDAQVISEAKLLTEIEKLKVQLKEEKNKCQVNPQSKPEP